MLRDNFRLQGLRKKMVADLRKQGFGNEPIWKILETLPRHYFIEDSAFRESIYTDQPFPIAAQQTISQPSTVAIQSALLDVKKREHVLEIGTGSGYQAAVLSKLGARVFTVERQKELYDLTSKKLVELGFSSIRCYFRDGSLGLPEFAPFDKILATAGAETIPQALIDQLKIGGRLVIPVGPADGIQEMLVGDKLADGSLRIKKAGDFRFVPFLGGKN